MTTLFRVEGRIRTGRGLWVKDDESLVYFASKTLVGRWTPANGVDTLASGFVGLGNLIVDGAGQLLVTDRDGNQVYRVSTSGGVQAIAGNHAR